MAIGGCVALAAVGLLGVVVANNPAAQVEAGTDLSTSQVLFDGATALGDIDRATTTVAFLARSGLPTIDGPGTDPAIAGDADALGTEAEADTANEVPSAGATPPATTSSRPSIPPATPDVETAPVFGIYAAAESEASRLASFTVVTGEIVTSASALDGRATAWLRSGGAWSQVQVAAVDPVTDLAILDLVGPAGDAQPVGADGSAGEPQAGAMPILKLADSPIELGTEAMAGYGQPPRSVEQQSDQPDRDDDRPRREGTLHGIVYSVSQPAMTTTNRVIYQPIRAGIDARADRSGGPLRNEQGDLIGVVVASDDPQIVAIPIERVAQVAHSLRTLGSGDPSWLGLELWPAGADGALVGHVDHDGPAAGLVPGDLIVAVADEAVTHPDLIHHRVRQAGVGSRLVIEVSRDGKRMLFELEIEAAPGSRTP